jgi:predicted HicB family RNase H-like nuclease
MDNERSDFMAIKSEAQKKAVAKYNAANYDQILLRVEKGKRAAITQHAESRGESLNAFINRAIDEVMERDNDK